MDWSVSKDTVVRCVVMVAVAASAFVVGIVFGLGLAPDPFRPRITSRRPTEEKPTALPELYASMGLEWSKERYPDQYVDANRATVQMTGLDDRENERFMDIEGKAYTHEFVRDFSYTDPRLRRPEVKLSYLRRAETFVGRIEATGLKPYFAYQLKLRGIFAERDSFERIGYLGRWRLPGKETNYKDKGYLASADKASVESYLLFDFMVTDGAGRVEKEFYADSSLHVLWNATLQRQPKAIDTRAQLFPRGCVDTSIYSNRRGEFGDQKIFVEAEHVLQPRPPVGRAFLPAGHYVAELVLTEEGFHGHSDAGRWATVMRAPVRFEIVDKPTRPVEWTRTVPVCEPLRAGTARLEDITTLRSTPEAGHAAVEVIEGAAGSNSSRIQYSERLNLPAGERYVVAAEILAAPSRTWALGVMNAAYADAVVGYYPIDCGKSEGWQRYEVEISRSAAGRTVMIRIRPSHKMGRIGVRNVVVSRIVE